MYSVATCSQSDYGKQTAHRGQATRGNEQVFKNQKYDVVGPPALAALPFVSHTAFVSLFY